MVQVIDASVALKWFIKEDGFETALTILEKVFADPNSYAVPELFYFELSHVFNRSFREATKKQYDLLKEVIQLGINRFKMTDELLDEITRFQKIGLSGYDSAYVALAEMLNGQWLTFDAKAHHIIRSYNLSILLK